MLLVLLNFSVLISLSLVLLKKKDEDEQKKKEIASQVMAIVLRENKNKMVSRYL
jgi:hypothetical protein